MNPNKLKPITFIAALFFTFCNCFAGDIESDEASDFASFIQDLVQTTQTSKQGVICIFGSDAVSKVLTTSRVNNLLDLTGDVRRYESCKAIYVAQGMDKGLRVEIEKFNKKGIMTIAIFDGFTELGGMVQVQMGRRNFELTINSKQLKASGVRLNALAMSIVIN